MSCGVGHRLGLDLAFLGLWCLAAVAPIRPLAWEPPYAEGVALKKAKKKIDGTAERGKFRLQLTYGLVLLENLIVLPMSDVCIVLTSFLPTVRE